LSLKYKPGSVFSNGSFYNNSFVVIWILAYFHFGQTLVKTNMDDKAESP
jgi:hypothetical protein